MSHGVRTLQVRWLADSLPAELVRALADENVEVVPEAFELDCLDSMPLPVLAGRTTTHDCAVAVP